MTFSVDVGLFKWASEGAFGLVKRWRECQRPLYRQARRFIEAFESHGVARQQVPRLMPESIRLTLQAVATPEALTAKLQLEHLDWAAETLALQREWFDAEGGQPHQIVGSLYKRPAAQHEWLACRTLARSGGYSALHVATLEDFRDPGQAEGFFFVAYEECFEQLGDKSISRYWYLSNGFRFGHAPCTVDLLTMLAIGECLGISAVGHVLPSKRIERAERGTLGLLPKALSEGRRWQPCYWVPTRYDAANCESDAHRKLWDEARRKLDGDGLQHLLKLPK